MKHYREAKLPNSQLLDKCTLHSLRGCSSEAANNKFRWDTIVLPWGVLAGEADGNTGPSSTPHPQIVSNPCHPRCGPQGYGQSLSAARCGLKSV